MIHIKRVLDDAVVVVDDADMLEFVVKKADWSRISMHPTEERRALVEEAVLGARVSGDPRTEAEQNQVDAASQGQGERHESDEEAR